MRLIPILLVAPLLAACVEPSDDGPYATVIVDFNGMRGEGDQVVESDVAYDPDSVPANDTRPDGYTVHDLMVDWSEETGIDIDVERHEAFGHRLRAVDGVVAHTTQGGLWHWVLHVDGQLTTAGMATVEVQEGSTYEWRFMHQSHAEQGAGEAEEQADPAPGGQEPGEPAGPMDEGPQSAEVRIDYGGFGAEEQSAAWVGIDAGSRPAAALYADAGAQRPDAYTAHDLLTDWAAQTGAHVVVEHHAALGFRVVEVNGVVAHSTQGGSWVWELYVDGQRAEGMSTVVVQDGQAYEWAFVHASRA